MAFGAGPRLAPILTISRWFAEKEPQILLQGGLIGFDDTQIRSAPAGDGLTEALLGM